MRNNDDSSSLFHFGRYDLKLSLYLYYYHLGTGVVRSYIECKFKLKGIQYFFSVYLKSLKRSWKVHVSSE